MRASIEDEVGALARLDLEELRSAWRERFGPPPPLRSVELLALCLAWRIQAQALGGLDTKTRKDLARTGAVQTEGLELGIGTRLQRNWKGQSVEVVIEEQGFRWDGRLFSSLSAVATAIAGTRWNGPRFFGLREAQS